MQFQVVDVGSKAARQEDLHRSRLHDMDWSVRMNMNAARRWRWLVLVVCLGPDQACFAGEFLQDYVDLKPVSFFGAITASLHIADSEGPPKTTDLSSEELTQFLRIQFAKYFPDIPYQSVDVSRWADEENARTMGRLACRVWIEDVESPVAYQVKCQISTTDHLNILGDASLGYGPREKVAAIVRQQIDRMVENFSLIFFRVRNEM